MKKSIAVILVLLLLGAIPSVYAEGQFVLRNGLTWGMSTEEVMAIEGEYSEISEQTLDGLSMSILFYEDCTVSKFAAQFGAFFLNNKLSYCAYFIENDAEAFQYLSRALASKYGERCTKEDLDVFTYNMISSMAEWEDEVTIWTTDDTAIVLIPGKAANSNENDSIVVYLATNTNWMELVYNTDGL